MRITRGRLPTKVLDKESWQSSPFEIEEKLIRMGLISRLWPMKSGLVADTTRTLFLGTRPSSRGTVGCGNHHKQQRQLIHYFKPVKGGRMSQVLRR